MSDFIAFPSQQEIIALLEKEHPSLQNRDALFENIGERLGSRVYDGAACTFILMEVLHEYQEAVGEDASELLESCVLALTSDEILAATARESFREIEELIAE